MALLASSIAIPVFAEQSSPATPTPMPTSDKPLKEFFFGSNNNRRSRIHRLHDRTGWQLSVCRRLVDSKTDQEIEELIIPSNNG